MAFALSMKWFGLQSAQKAYQTAGRRIDRELKKKLSQAARIVVKDAKPRAPRRTGKLRKSISFSILRGGNVEIGPRAFYGIFGEFGTVRQPARPFLGPAIEATQEQVFDILGESFNVV